MAEKIRLDWSCFYNKNDFINESFFQNKNKICTVYVWGWKNDKCVFKPFYVGSTTDLLKRIFEHIGKLNGGHYCIYSIEYFFSDKFKRFSDKKFDTEPLYLPSNISNIYQTFISNQIVLDTVKWLVDHFTITYAKTEKKYYREIEKYISNIIGQEKLGSTVKGKYNLENEIEITSAYPEVKKIFNV
ncbi:MAG: hypothetical protein ABR968_12180 [Bacteroidales bacterium]|jgi:hypothetical protein